MIVNGKLLCREQNLTDGEIMHFMGCRTLEAARAEIERVRHKWEDVDKITGAAIVYGVAGDEVSCYVFTPEDLLVYMGYRKQEQVAVNVYNALLERVKLSYCETEDKSDYYSILELYMDLGDILES